MSKSLSIVAVLVFALFLSSTQAVQGVDVSQPTDTFQCMKETGVQFAIVRAYLSIGSLDTNAVATLTNAQNSGLITDIYHFPCTAVSPSDQVQAVMNGINSSLYGTVWIDVEENPSSRCGWSSDFNQNCEFLSNLANTYISAGASVGIYASQHQWQTIFGDQSNCPYFTSLPVWYAHYDGVPSFSDWPNYSFGGWTQPSIKQYKGTTSLCNSGVDLNFY